MLGLQLYTVRGLAKTETDSERTLSELQKIGYQCVQLAGDIETVELTAAVCKKRKMPAVGILTDMEVCERYSERLFAAAELVGAADIGISSFTKNEAEAFDMIRRVNSFAKIALGRGFSFSYHNHSNEFIRTECGKTVMELYIEGFDKTVCLMPDTYWLQHGGIDVRAFIAKHGKRTKILHLKDMKRVSDGQSFAELGEGNMNFDDILYEASLAGIKYYIVEQDISENPLKSAKISFEFMKKYRV